MKKESLGYIYIASNPSFSHIKIGISKNYPDKRMRELSTTGLPDSFTLEYCAKTKNHELVEKLVHRELAKYRYKKNREFFDLPILDAIATIRKMSPTLIKENIFFQSEEEIAAQLKAKKITAGANKVPEKIETIKVNIFEHLLDKEKEKKNSFFEFQKTKKAYFTFLLTVAVSILWLCLVVVTDIVRGFGETAVIVMSYLTVAALLFFNLKMNKLLRVTRAQRVACVKTEVDLFLEEQKQILLKDENWDKKLPGVEFEAKKLLEERYTAWSPS